MSGGAFVTDGTVRTERGMPALLRASVDASGPQADAEAVRTGGQKEAARTVLLRQDLVVGVQGYAGRGKTAMPNAAAVRALPASRRGRCNGSAPAAATSPTTSWTGLRWRRSANALRVRSW